MPVFIPQGYMHVIQPLTLTGAGKPYSVTMGLRPSDIAGGSGPGDPTFQDVIDEFNDCFVSNFQSFLDSGCSIGRSVGYRQNAEGLYELYESEDAPVNGTRAVTGTPPNCAAVVRKRTRFVGKAQRGRFFLPCVLDETNVSETGVLTPTFIAALQTRCDEFLADLEAKAAIERMVVLHSDEILDPTVVELLLVQPIVRTQRRRLPKG